MHRILLRGGSAVAESPAPGGRSARAQVAEGYRKAIGLKRKLGGRGRTGNADLLTEGIANTTDAGNHETDIIRARLGVGDSGIRVG